MSLGMKKQWLSPSLHVWRTAVNSKLLITGSLGVDPLLVEEKSNYPRFKILVENGIKGKVNKQTKTGNKATGEGIKQEVQIANR